MWERMLHSLGHRGISREAYLRVVGRQEADILAEMEPEAEQALRREAVLTAVVEAEGIDPSEEDLLEALRDARGPEGVEPPQLLEELRSAGRLDELRDDVAARQAVELIAGQAVAIPIAQAQAREQLWTPARAAAEASGGEGAQEPPSRLWTPADRRSAS